MNGDLAAYPVQKGFEAPGRNSKITFETDPVLP